MSGKAKEPTQNRRSQGARLSGRSKSTDATARRSAPSQNRRTRCGQIGRRSRPTHGAFQEIGQPA